LSIYDIKNRKINKRKVTKQILRMKVVENNGFFFDYKWPIIGFKYCVHKSEKRINLSFAKIKLLLIWTKFFIYEYSS